jgi:hypothetical protein
MPLLVHVHICSLLAHLPMCSINHATNDGSYTPYINVVRGSDHDISIDARRRTVKVNGQ